jgi:hypothetical protein
MSDRPFNCPKCNTPTEFDETLCADCQPSAFDNMNIHMLLDGMRTAERYEREFTEQLCDAERTDAGPGERAALISLKLCAYDTARKFITEIARRAEAK